MWWGEVLNNGWPSIECDEVAEEEDGYTKRKVALINICEYIMNSLFCMFLLVYNSTYPSTFVLLPKS